MAAACSGFGLLRLKNRIIASNIRVLFRTLLFSVPSLYVQYFLNIILNCHFLVKYDFVHQVHRDSLSVLSSMTIG